MFEGLKKLWKEAKQKAEDTDDSVIRMNISVDEPTPIDIEIAVLVAEMNRVGIETVCSCQGHDDGEAYVSIRLGEGTTYNHRKDIFGPGQDELTLKWRRK